MRLWVGVASLPLAIAALLAPAPAGADPRGVDLNGRRTLDVPGGTGSATGHAIAAVGDVDADGAEDILIGAPYADPRDRKDAGRVYLVLGGGSFGNLDLVKGKSARVIRIDGARRGDRLGEIRTLGGRTDVNGDGFADYLIGARRHSFGRRTNAGRTYVIYGRAEPRDLDLGKFSAADGFVIGGAGAGDGSGTSVAGVPDFNNDGFGDVAVGAPFSDRLSQGRDDDVIGRPRGSTKAGTAYVVFGQPGSTDVDLARLVETNRGVRIDGETSGSRLGISVAAAGYLNGDSKADLVVGADAADNNGRRDSGSAYVIFGRDAGAVDVSQIIVRNAVDGYRIDGEIAAGRAGTSVAGVGDVTKDGQSDVAVGAPYVPNGKGRSRAGAVYVINGATRLSVLDARDRLGRDGEGYVIRGAQDGDLTGWAVTGVSDLNGDGRAEILAGAYEADSLCRGGSGSAYLVYGGLGGDLRELQPGEGIRVDGAGPGDRLGWSVASSGSTMLLGAYRAWPDKRRFAGAAYVLPGSIQTKVTPTLGPGDFPLAITVPGGFAGDYERYLSIPVRPLAGIARNVRARIYSFGGEDLGKSPRIRSVSVSRTLDVRLRRRLTPGGYTAIITAKGDRHRFCGGGEKKIVMQFK